MVRVYKATLEDEGKVVDLLRQLFARSASRGVKRDLDAGARVFRGMAKDDRRGAVLLAEENGIALGLITLSYPEAIRCGGIYACVEEFIVTEKARGKGIGGQLLEAAITEATAQGCDEIMVNRPSEQGLPVYLAHGLKDGGKSLVTKLPRNRE